MTSSYEGGPTWDIHLLGCQVTPKSYGSWRLTEVLVGSRLLLVLEKSFGQKQIGFIWSEVPGRANDIILAMPPSHCEVFDCDYPSNMGDPHSSSCYPLYALAYSVISDIGVFIRDCSIVIGQEDWPSPPDVPRGSVALDGKYALKMHLSSKSDDWAIVRISDWLAGC